MKKLIRIALVLVVLVAVLAVVGLFYLGNLVKAGVEKVGPAVTKVPVTLGSAKVSILGGSGTLKDFVIGNPEGYKSPAAIKVGVAHVSIVPRSILGDKVIIRSIRVEGPEITYEKTGLTGSNLGQILDNLGGEKKPGAPESKEPATSGGSSKKLQVDEFIITGAKVHVKVPLIDPYVQELPEMKLSNLGQGPDGITPQELGQRALTLITEATAKAVAEKAPGVSGKAAETLNKATDAVKDLFKKK
jgi:uncharacterized protein involved in outer membrane biogenesis